MGKAGKMILMHLLFGECTKAEPIKAGCSRKNECVPVIILKDVFSLLIVTLTVMIIACWASLSAQCVTLPFCRSFITVMPLSKPGHTHTHTSVYTHRHINRYAHIQNLVQACQGRDILIHYVRIGLLFSLTSAVATAKARQSNNASTGARRHTRKCLKRSICSGQKG